MNKTLAAASAVALSFFLVVACTKQQAVQNSLNANAAICAVNAADPALAPAELEAFIIMECGALPEIRDIANAASKKLAVTANSASASASARAVRAACPPSSSR